ncbi:hypothetical protein EJ04DRAFT_451154, partial [Polyplosphaeria fusca]
YFEDSTLSNHTIYQPKDPSGLKLPVIAWANGGCANQGLSHQSFLTEVTSYGAFAIAVGPVKGNPGGGGPPPSGNSSSIPIFPERQKAAIDWVVKNAGKGNYTHVDTSRIAVWGMSCGGIETYVNWADERVSSIGIFNSGQLAANESIAIASKINKPIFYFMGGPTDIAYENGERDYANLPGGTPAWLGNDGLGHGGSFGKPNAGPIAIAGVHFMQWLLRGNASAGAFFTNGDALKSGYTDNKSKDLDKLNITSIQRLSHWVRN